MIVPLLLSCEDPPETSSSLTIGASYEQYDGGNLATAVVMRGLSFYSGEVTATVNGQTLDPFLFSGTYAASLAANLDPGTMVTFVISVEGTEMVNAGAIVPDAVAITAMGLLDASSPIDISWTGPTDVDEYLVHITDGGDLEYERRLPGNATGHQVPAGTLLGESSYFLDVYATNRVTVTGEGLSLSSVEASASDSDFLDTD